MGSIRRDVCESSSVGVGDLINKFNTKKQRPFQDGRSLSRQNSSSPPSSQSQFDAGLIQRKTVGEIIFKDGETTSDCSPPKLFTPFAIRGQIFQNRIHVSPMCMYSVEKQDGVFSDFHLAHLGNLALRGPSLVFCEATGIEPQGRLTPQCTGIWNQEQADSLARIARLVKASGSKFGIQLAHGGRKSGTYPPYHNYEESGGKLIRGVCAKEDGGFINEIVAPTAMAWKEGHAAPKELSRSEIKEIVKKFASAAKRSVEAGVDVIEIHGAHGYLIHEFLSGNTNKRTDEYGGSFENRTRFVLEILAAVRAVMPQNMPLYLRVSGTDYAKGDEPLLKDPNGWDIYQVIDLCRKAVPLGLDVIDISSGGNISTVAKGIMGSDFGFQVPLAAEVKKARIPGLLVATVGALNDGKRVEKVLQEDKADIIMVARQFIKNPSLVYTFAEDLGVKVRWASQYSWMWPW